MAKTTKTTKTTTKTTKVDTKAIEAAKLQGAEAQLVAKYGEKIVAGSIQRGTGKYEGKMTVEIRTRGVDGEFDGKTLRCATSDVFQLSHQPEVRDILRKARAADKRAKAKALRDAAKAEAKPEAKAKSEEEANAALAASL